MAYRGPTLITEPELRWPVILLAAAITSVVMLVTAGVFHLAMTRPSGGGVSERRLDGAMRGDSAEFEELSGLLVVEQLAAAEAPTRLGDPAVEITGTLRNTTGRTVTGLELRGVILDATSSPMRERSVVVIPARQTALEPGEAINVSIRLEGIRPEAERSVPVMPVMEVTGLRFE